MRATDVCCRPLSKTWLQQGRGRLSTWLECHPAHEAFISSGYSYMCGPGCSCSILTTIAEVSSRHCLAEVLLFIQIYSFKNLRVIHGGQGREQKSVWEGGPRET